jgi:hypothetical protein
MRWFHLVKLAKNPLRNSMDTHLTHAKDKQSDDADHHDDPTYGIDVRPQTTLHRFASPDDQAGDEEKSSTSADQ